MDDTVVQHTRHCPECWGKLERGKCSLCGFDKEKVFSSKELEDKDADYEEWVSKRPQDYEEEYDISSQTPHIECPVKLAIKAYLDKYGNLG